MYCQEPLLRGASRCHILEILTHFTKFSNLRSPDEDIFESFKCLMNFAGTKDILIRRTNLWYKVLFWVKPDLNLTTYDKLLTTLEFKAQNTTSKIRYQWANVLGFVSVIWGDIQNQNSSIVTNINDLWNRILSVANRPYSTIAFHHYIYCLASVMKVLNPPLKRTGKDNLFRFCELEAENFNFYSEFVIENISEICIVMRRYFQTIDTDNILYLDDAILVLSELLKMINIHDRVFGSLNPCGSRKANAVVEMFVEITKEYSTINLNEDSNTNKLRKLSLVKVLGHDWWSAACRCYRFSNLNREIDHYNYSHATFPKNCSRCDSIGPVEFRAMLRELCAFDWISSSTIAKFPSLQLMQPVQKEYEILSRDEHQFWGTLQCQFIASQWKCIRNWLIIYHCQPKSNNSNDACQVPKDCFKLFVNNGDSLHFPFDVEYLVCEGMSALCVGGLDVLVPVQNCIAYLTNLHGNDLQSGPLEHKHAPDIFRTIVKELIPQAKSAVFDARKNEVFWPALEAFVEMSLGSCLLIYDDLIEDNLELLRQLFTLSETINGISCLVIKHLAKVSKYTSIHFDFVKEMVALATLSGSIHKKDQAHYMKANHLIYNEGGENISANLIEGSDHLLQSDAKACAIAMLSSVIKSNEGRKGIVNDFIVAIKQQATKLIGNRDKHYFENSFTHLILIRMHQLFLCMANLTMEEDDVKQLLCLVLNRITNELGHQLSVRYLCEWTVIILATSNNHQFEQLVLSLVHESFNTAKISRPNCIPSYIVILSHIAMINLKSSKNHAEHSKKLMADSMNVISPWCMAQQFTTRLYAQIFFKRLYIQASERGLRDVLETFSVLHNCVSESLILGDKEKNCDKIMGDFYLTTFDPQIHFNLENIFYDFPRLMNILSQELVKIDSLRANISEGKISERRANELSNAPIKILFIILRTITFRKPYSNISTTQYLEYPCIQA